MMAAWAANYVGLPFKDGGRTREGLDCYGLVVAIYRDVFAIDLPAYEGSYVSAHERDEIAALLADRIPAELDPADFRLRSADGPRRFLCGDAAALSQPPQLDAQQDPQHGRAFRRLWHDASRISAAVRNCFSQLRGNALPPAVRSRHGIPYAIACHLPILAGRPTAADTSVSEHFCLAC